MKTEKKTSTERRRSALRNLREFQKKYGESKPPDVPKLPGDEMGRWIPSGDLPPGSVQRLRLR